MNERKVESASHPYYVMDDGALWHGEATILQGILWTRIPGPPADPPAKAADEAEGGA